MKKLTVLVAFLALNLAAAAADTNPDVRIEKTAEAKKFSLELTNIDAAATTVNLYDANGVALLTEKATNNYYGKVFNMANLPAGSYELVVTTTNRDIVQPITLTANGIEMDANKRTVYFAPVILTKNTNVDVSYFRGKITDVTVGIYHNNELVFEEDFENVIKVERRYNVSSLPKGTYYVRVSTDYKTYYRELVIN